MARGGAGDRLLMYAQLKEWAEKNFDIKQWYPEGDLPKFYSDREGMKGWNLFQLMHRKARGDDVGKTKFGERNYCAESNGNAADKLMLCASGSLRRIFRSSLRNGIRARMLTSYRERAR